MLNTHVYFLVFHIIIINKTLWFLTVFGVIKKIQYIYGDRSYIVAEGGEELG